MFANWRISSFNGALLAAYFIPTWTIVAFRIMISPIHGLYERPNISVALFVERSSAIWPAMATVRFAWLLALGRLTVVAFFAIFLVFITRASTRKSGGCDEALGMALGIGSVISFASMVMASQVGETAALRLHATELLMLLGTAIVLLVERPAPKPAGREHAVADLSLQQPQLHDDRGCLLDGMICCRHAAIDRLLQDDFLDVVGRETAFRKRRAHMQAEFIPLTERDHGADHCSPSAPMRQIEGLPEGRISGSS